MPDAFTAGVLVVGGFRAVLQWSNGFYSRRFVPSPKFQGDQNELGIATSEDVQSSFGRNVRSKIR